MSLPVDFPPLERHTFIEQEHTADCRRCGMPFDFGGLHPEPVREHVETLQVWRRGDVVQNPASHVLFTAVSDGAGGLQWLELAPAAAHAQDHPPKDAVLLVRGGQVQR